MRKKVLFIHRSVGHHLLQHGKLRELLSAKGISLDDYDNNTGLLTRNDGTTAENLITIPDNNTNPDNLAAFFTGWPDLLSNYDLIVVKSCYPNSHIRDKVHLDAIKKHYQIIFKAFKAHQKALLLLTTPPLRPLFTNSTEARLANDLADWLVASAKPNLYIFDLHHHYTEKTGKHKGMLKRDYRQLLPWDNHPNPKAHQMTAPLIADFIGKT